MFVLDNYHSQLFAWYDIFLVLGLDKTHPFLVDMDFPVYAQYREVQIISRQFVKKVFDNVLVLFDKNHPSQTAQNLFQEVYTTLAHQIGEENTQSFCRWGNALRLNSKQDKTLNRFWDKLLIASRTDSRQHPDDAEMYPLRMLINRYNHSLRTIYHDIDTMETALLTEWDELAYKWYVRIGDDFTNPHFTGVSPLLFVSGIITYLELSKLLNQLRTIPDSEALLLRLGVQEMYAELNIMLP